MDEKSTILVSVSDDITATYDARNLLDSLSKIIGAKGGGKSDFAQAGGPASDKLDEIYLLGLNNGAIGGKLLGAGGGGFIAFIVEKNKKDNFIKKMKPYGSIPIKVDKIGSRIIYKNL